MLVGKPVPTRVRCDNERKRSDEPDKNGVLVNASAWIAHRISQVRIENVAEAQDQRSWEPGTSITFDKEGLTRKLGRDKELRNTSLPSGYKIRTNPSFNTSVFVSTVNFRLFQRMF